MLPCKDQEITRAIYASAKRRLTLHLSGQTSKGSLAVLEILVICVTFAINPSLFTLLVAANNNCRLMRKDYLFCFVVCISWVCYGNAQKGKLKTVRTIYEAAGQNALFTAPNGKTYKIEFWNDRNDPPRKKFTTFRKSARQNNTGFTGASRIAAKTSYISAGSYRSFSKLKDVFRLYRLPPDSVMSNLLTRDSPRISIEQRGVILKNAFLFAFRKQRDNDYHLIVGDHPQLKHAFLMTMEISGLPKKKNTVLAKVRTDFVNAFNINDQIAMATYLVFTEPVPVHVEGPLFYDVSHRAGSVGPRKGKISMKLRTAWEIHPVTKFNLRE